MEANKKKPLRLVRIDRDLWQNIPDIGMTRPLGNKTRSTDFLTVLPGVGKGASCIEDEATPQ